MLLRNKNKMRATDRPRPPERRQGTTCPAARARPAGIAAGRRELGQALLNAGGSSEPAGQKEAWRPQQLARRRRRRRSHQGGGGESSAHTQVLASPHELDGSRLTIVVVASRAPFILPAGLASRDRLARLAPICSRARGVSPVTHRCSCSPCAPA